VIRVLIDCGLRVSELTGVDVDDLDLDGESVTVVGKGSRVRIADFGNKTGLALDRYLRAHRGHRQAADPGLFLGERGRFTPDGVRHRFLRCLGLVEARNFVHRAALLPRYRRTV
jgi:site-specific recombinase XerC